MCVSPSRCLIQDSPTTCDSGPLVPWSGRLPSSLGWWGVRAAVQCLISGTHQSAPTLPSIQPERLARVSRPWLGPEAGAFGCDWVWGVGFEVAVIVG